MIVFYMIFLLIPNKKYLENYEFNSVREMKNVAQFLFLIFIIMSLNGFNHEIVNRII